MPTVLLVRHGRTDANSGAVLAGQTPGTLLDAQGRQQATAIANRLATVRLAAVVSSPLERCLDTAAAIVAAGDHPDITVDERLTECDYGDWTGQTLARLRRQKLWKLVQDHPSGATFPSGESLRAVQARAVAAVREHDACIAAGVGDRAIWAAVSHGDVIKTVIADALGLHLDLFQRIVVDPGSLTVITFTRTRPFVVRLNDTGPAPLQQPTARRGRSGDAVVGGGDGAA